MTPTTDDPQINHHDRIAEAVSSVFHPFIVVIPTMLIAILEHGASFWQALFWTVLSIGVVIIPLAFLIYSGVRSGRFSDPSISMREQRRSLYISASLLFILLIVILVLGKAPSILIACLTSAVLATLIGFAINSRFTKLSLHSIAIAGCTAVMILTVPWLGVTMALIVMPLLAWARIHLRHHTVAQILIGWIVAAVCVWFIFHMFHLLS